jgi:hypothetical protein
MKKKHGLLFGFAVLLMVIAAIFAFSLAGCSSGGGGDDDDPTDPSNPSCPSCPEVDGRSYRLGDTGPGSGKIFYVSTAGFTMTDDSSTCHYLEAAPKDIIDTKAWASTSYQTQSISGTGTDIGTGRKNTVTILATDVAAPAALACKNLATGGKTDWFLPSKDELAKLYENRDSVGISVLESYWSSSAFSSSLAWSQYFSSGSQNYNNKGSNYRVRAVRAF